MRNLILYLLCLNFPRLSEKYFILFIHKLPDEGQTLLLSDLHMARTQPKTSHLHHLLSYFKLKLTKSPCGKSAEQNKQLTLASAYIGSLSLNMM